MLGDIGTGKLPAAGGVVELKCNLTVFFGDLDAGNGSSAVVWAGPGRAESPTHLCPSTCLRPLRHNSGTTDKNLRNHDRRPDSSPTGILPL